jgi:hypothetical protein
MEKLSMIKQKVSADEAKRHGATLGINLATLDRGQFQRDLEVEFEHSARSPKRTPLR